MPPPVLDCYAITPPGVEVLTAGELGALGLSPGVAEPGGVSLRTDLRGVAVANLELRTASRVLVRVATFHASAFHEVELVSALSTTNGGTWVRLLTGTVPAAA
jgi:putative N6-adenine-specific DNA methylase